MVFILYNACQQEKDKISDFLKGLDTTVIVDENGKKWTLISHASFKGKIVFDSIQSFPLNINFLL